MTKTYCNESKLADIVSKFNTMDMAQILSCFSDDVVTRYNGAAPIIGKPALQAFLNGRYADITDYHLQKSIRLEHGDQVGVEAHAEFTRKSNGERVRLVIHEFLEFKGAQISRWDYVGQAL